MLFRAAAILATFVLGVRSQNFPNPEAVSGNTAIHDPTMCKDASGTYWLFGTGTGIEIRTSPDRVTWTFIGAVWPDGAPWTDEFTGVSNGVLWAPDCTFADGQFYLYYAASTFGSQNSGIFFAKSTTGQPGSWTNEGLVTSSSSADDYNAIDPNLLIDGSSWFLSLGSFWTGIKEITLGPTTGKPTSTAITSLSERTADGGAIEASVVFKTGDFYYLFSSWDLCCMGTSSTYNIRVGRSSSATGPFVDQSGVDLLDGGGTLILGTHGSIVGPGGQDILVDTDGIILVYHYYTATGSFLGLNHLDFSSGWPVVTA